VSKGDSTAHTGTSTRTCPGQAAGGWERFARARLGPMTNSRAMLLVCGLAAALAQRPLPPALPCGWEAAWNGTLHAYSYRNVFTDKTIPIPPTPPSFAARNEWSCPAAFALGTYGIYQRIDVLFSTHVSCRRAIFLGSLMGGEVISYWCVAFTMIGYPRYHLDILESVTPFSSDTL
jgi:hypothetical protein